MSPAGAGLSRNVEVDLMRREARRAGITHAAAVVSLLLVGVACLAPIAVVRVQLFSLLMFPLLLLLAIVVIVIVWLCSSQLASGAFGRLSR